MPTTVVKTIGSGGDHATVPLWESNNQGDLPTADEIRIGRMLDSFQGTAKITINGWTTDATRYWQLENATNHGGMWNTGVGRISTTDKDTFKITDTNSYGRLLGCQFELTGGTDIVAFMKFQNTTGQVNVQRCIIRRTGGTGSAGKNLTGLEDKNASALAIVANCLFVGWRDTVGNGGLGLDCDSTLVYNNGFYDCDIGTRAAGGSRVKNSWAQACTDGFSGTWHADSTHNCSDITSDAPGASPQTGTIAFVSAGTDYHLASGDTLAAENGTSLASDPQFAFSIDFENESRPQGTNWDIGPDERAAAGGADTSLLYKRPGIRQMIGR